MSILVKALKNEQIMYNPGAVDVKMSYYLGDGNHEVKISGNMTDVITGDGNSVIEHDGDSAVIITGNGDQIIESTGNNKIIRTGNGNSKILSVGDNVKIETGNGNNRISSIGDNTKIETGDGDDEVVFIGNNSKVNTGAGDDKLVFWGNNCEIKMGDGDDFVSTYDKYYTKEDTSLFSAAFIDRLATTTSENYTAKTSDLIDTVKKTKRSFLRKKVTITYFYENHYNVDTILSKHVNMQNTTIDLGSGNNKADVTLGDNSKIEPKNDNDDIRISQKYTYDENIGSRDEVKIETHTTKKSGFGWCL